MSRIMLRLENPKVALIIRVDEKFYKMQKFGKQYA